ncbi:MAG: hypothetical protein RSB14_07110, partial [Kiritimatiellia bacterium]
AQFSIANAYGDRLTDAADSFFINGEYRKAFLYFRRRGLRAGAIYCYEYGVGTTQLPKILIWILKGCGWILGDFNPYDYRLLSGVYNNILEERNRNDNITH